MSKYSVGGYEIPTLLLNEIKILDLRFKQYPDIQWVREKYDFINKSK